MLLLFGLLLPFFGIINGWLCLPLIAAILLYYYMDITKKQNYWKEKGIKYIKPKFIMGTVDIQSKPLPDIITEIYNAYSDERYFGFYQFSSAGLLIKDPDLIKLITVKEFDHFVNHRPFTDADGDPFWSKNLLGSKDERWREMRSTLSPSFTGSKMKIMYNLMDECAQQFADHFKKESEEVIELEMKEALRRYTCDVIATTAFGIKCDSLKNKENEFYVMGLDASNMSGLRLWRFFAYIISPTLSKLFKLRVIPKYISDYFSQIIERTVQTRKEENIVRPDMIHLLLEAQKEDKKHINMDDISAHAFIFFLGGFDTVSSLLSFTFYELALNPEVQNRLREEIQSVSDEMTYETLSGLKYLEMVISEVLRKWPPFSMTDREVTKEFTIEPVKPGEKPLRLDKNVFCSIPIYPLHNDPKFYPNPEKFDPERFSDENKHKIHSSTYLPFGAGPRNCIGARFATLESKLIVAHVLKNFEIVTIEKTPIPVIFEKSQINLKAKGGMWLGLRKLNQ